MGPVAHAPGTCASGALDVELILARISGSTRSRGRSPAEFDLKMNEKADGHAACHPRNGVDYTKRRDRKMMTIHGNLCGAVGA